MFPRHITICSKTHRRVPCAITLSNKNPCNLPTPQVLRNFWKTPKTNGFLCPWIKKLLLLCCVVSYSRLVTAYSESADHFRMTLSRVLFMDVYADFEHILACCDMLASVAFLYIVIIILLLSFFDAEFFIYVWKVRIWNWVFKITIWLLSY